MCSVLWGVFSTFEGYLENRGGYLEYCGDILNAVGDVHYRGGYQEKCEGTECPTIFMISPTVLNMKNVFVLSILQGTEDIPTVLNILHGA